MTTIESLEKLRADTSEQEAHFRKHGDVSEADMYEEIVARLDDVRQDVAAAVKAERERVLMSVFALARHASRNVVTGDEYWAYRERDVAELAAELRGKEGGT